MVKEWLYCKFSSEPFYVSKIHMFQREQYKTNKVFNKSLALPDNITAGFLLYHPKKIVEVAWTCCWDVKLITEIIADSDIRGSRP